jgi:hypothetical protein
MPLGAFRLNSLARYVAPVAEGRPLTVTAYGNAQVDTAQSKFGGASAKFDGSGDYLITEENDLFEIAGDFTIECWMRSTNVTVSQNFINSRSEASTDYFAMRIYNSQLYWNINGSSFANTSISSNTWYHCALVRSGSTVTAYLNGSSKGSTTFSGAISTTGSNAIMIGGYNAPTVSQPLNGHIDEVRISSVARYTSNFTAPTSAFYNDEDTLLLLHMDGNDGSTTFEDDNVSVAPPDYTVPTAAFADDSATLLLLHNDGTNGSTTITDSSSNAFTLSALGNAQLDTGTKQFGTASLELDGTGDYVRITNATTELIDWDAGDFTVEAWVYVRDLASTSYSNGGNLVPNMIGNMEPGNNTNYWSFGPTSDGKLSLFYYRGSTDFNYSTSAPITENTWHHIAFTYNATSGDITFWCDGFIVGTASYLGTGGQSTGVATIIGAHNGVEFDGFIDELRISNAVRYPTYTPPAGAAWDNYDGTANGSYTQIVNGDADAPVYGVIMFDDTYGIFVYGDEGNKSVRYHKLTVSGTSVTVGSAVDTGIDYDNITRMLPLKLSATKAIVHCPYDGNAGYVAIIENSGGTLSHTTDNVTSVSLTPNSIAAICRLSDDTWAMTGRRSGQPQVFARFAVDGSNNVTGTVTTGMTDFDQFMYPLSIDNDTIMVTGRNNSNTSKHSVGVYNYSGSSWSRSGSLVDIVTHNGYSVSRQYTQPNTHNVNFFGYLYAQTAGDVGIEIIPVAYNGGSPSVGTGFQISDSAIESIAVPESNEQQYYAVNLHVVQPDPDNSPDLFVAYYEIRQSDNRQGRTHIIIPMEYNSSTNTLTKAATETVLFGRGYAYGYIMTPHIAVADANTLVAIELQNDHTRNASVADYDNGVIVIKDE